MEKKFAKKIVMYGSILEKLEVLLITLLTFIYFESIKSKSNKE